MSERFYHPGIASLDQINISGPEANHIAKVMRMTVGDHLKVFDGSGLEFECEIVKFDKKTVSLKKIVAITTDRELPFQIHIGLALPKSDRQRFLIEKLTELGVAGITPLNTQRSIAKATPTNFEKFSRYIVEASKQCGRNQLMEIHAPCNLVEFADKANQPSFSNWMCLMADPNAKCGIPERESHDVLIVVGPEGGFSTDEVDACQIAGFKPVNMGRRILRTETAAIALASKYSIS